MKIYLNDNNSSTGDSKVQKGGNNGQPLNEKPQNLRPVPNSSEQRSEDKPKKQ